MKSVSKRILLFYPPNNRSVAMETLCDVVREAGHEIIVLTLRSRGAFHDAVESQGISTFCSSVLRESGPAYFVKQAKYLRNFCSEHNIDTVWSQLQEANLVAVLAQSFMKARVVTFRHHSESVFYAEVGTSMGLKRNPKETRVDRIINRLSKHMVVLSTDAWRSLELEGCNMKKAILLPLIYDFSKYARPDDENVSAIRSQYDCQLLLLMIGRMIPSKQHMPAFKVVKKLVEEGMSVKMIVMDDGDLKNELQQYMDLNNLQENIAMVGFKNNFVDFMAAGDLLLHPSLTEASSNVVKEMGLLEKAVAVCGRVGDFDDYIIDNVNGYVLDRRKLEETIENVIRDAYINPNKLNGMGVQLSKDVTERFGNTEANKQKVFDLAKR